MHLSGNFGFVLLHKNKNYRIMKFIEDESSRRLKGNVMFCLDLIERSKKIFCSGIKADSWSPKGGLFSAMNIVDDNIYGADLGNKSLAIFIGKPFYKRAGFTLMELMLVVVLVGILVSLAVGSYSNFHKRAKTSEAKANLGNIRTYEESYYLTEENYLACPLHPTTVPQGITVFWSDTQVPDEWKELGFEPQGRIRYSYKVETSSDGQSFTATANGDLDGDGTYSTFSIGDSGGEIQESLPLE